MGKPSLFLAVSLDVEEEGLFSNQYDVLNVGVSNTAALERLIPFLNMGIRPTLFCAYSVLKDPSSRAILTKLKESGCEIGAHLHHWNTPPLSTNQASLSSVPASAVDDEIFAEKLAAVLELGASLANQAITSFRMGRWDLHQNRFPILARLGIRTDASVRPLHGKKWKSSEPDHFTAPREPYFVPTEYGNIFEVPLTVTPILQCLPKLIDKLPNKKISNFLKATMHYWGALAMLPVYHPLFAMTTITTLAVARGLDVLVLTWHSSEMMPGATPHLPSSASVEQLLTKIKKYLIWLNQHYTVTSVTMEELRQHYAAKATVRQSAYDWSTLK